MWGWLEQRLIKKLEDSKAFCKNCNAWETMRITKEFTSFKCKCGVTVYYPPSKDVDFPIKRFISAEEYYFNRNKDHDSLMRELKEKNVVVKEKRD